MLSSPYLNDIFFSQSKIYSAVLPLPWPNQKREDAKTWPGFTLSLFLFPSLCVFVCLCVRECVCVCVCPLPPCHPRSCQPPIRFCCGVCVAHNEQKHPHHPIPAPQPPSPYIPQLLTAAFDITPVDWPFTPKSSSRDRHGVQERGAPSYHIPLSAGGGCWPARLWLLFGGGGGTILAQAGKKAETLEGRR